MREDLGQNKNVWSQEWGQLTPESEIRMWDFYGLRNWILKYTPRFGKTVEAGCGLGRYVFYLSELGIDIEGIDFSDSTIDFLNDWKKKNNSEVVFKTGNVTKLEYPDNSLSGYISLGVMEHFIEGPQKALEEAYRVLRPGGIAIITTPNVSFSILNQRIKKSLKNFVKRILRKNIHKEPFYQYWYTPGRLKKFVNETGLRVTKNKGADLLFALYENGNYNVEKIKKGSFGYWFSNKFENSCLSNTGAQSITISVKAADEMHCFLCGKLEAKKTSLEKFDVPLCSKCSESHLAVYYKKNMDLRYSGFHEINTPLMKVRNRECDFCRKEYTTDEIFEDFGFSKNVCRECLKIKEINIRLANDFVKPVWRKRMDRNG
jgi:ubiquinone/menaquinone biosynthesis C-methylase UbiE